MNCKLCELRAECSLFLSAQVRAINLSLQEQNQAKNYSMVEQLSANQEYLLTFMRLFDEKCTKTLEVAAAKGEQVTRWAGLKVLFLNIWQRAMVHCNFSLLVYEFGRTCSEWHEDLLLTVSMKDAMNLSFINCPRTSCCASGMSEAVCFQCKTGDWLDEDSWWFFRHCSFYS